MSFLSPLYAIAGLAIVLPILFHMVRKRPKERQLFSSLMFLEPAPPRLTRQSRIDQWLLLLLRALALGLLAFAFSRPYWNVAAETNTSTAGMRRMVLIDCSASMRREGLWDLAIARAQKVIQQSNPTDVVALYTFDRSLKPLVSVEEADLTAPAQRQQLAISGLRTIKPTWMSTDLGTALVNAADLLQADTDSNSDAASEASEIVVITDFQNGMQLNSLSGHTWPTTCKVRIERVEPTNSGNARATILSPVDSDETLEKSEDQEKVREKEPLASRETQTIRVRVANQAQSPLEQFQLAWLDSQGQEIPGTQTQCQVPAGNAMVVRMPIAPSSAQTLRLVGDKSDFDNQYFVAKREPANLKLLCVDAVAQTPEDALGYFLEQLPLSDPTRTVTYELRKPGSDEDWPTPALVPLIVASHHATPSDLFGLSKFAEQGGSVLWALDAPGAKYSERLQRFVGKEVGNVSEAKVKQYAMLQQIDFKHPLFVDLSSSRFNDFTKVRFWKHRRLELKDEKEWEVIARFDDGSPALMSQSHGAGKIWILMSGWQPTQSQLALSSKFVPILAGLFRLAAPASIDRDKSWVGDRIVINQGDRWIDPTGSEVKGTELENKGQALLLEQPGVYHCIDSRGNDSPIAVNLADSESQTTIADIERLERLGVGMVDARPADRKESAQRQLRAVELESQQGWWRWLVIGVLGAAGIESLLCIGRNKYA
jgi:hypothetical protein